MDWIRTILVKHVSEDGKLDMEAALKEINKSAPENVVPKYKYNELSEAKQQLDANIKDRDKQLETLRKVSGNTEELQKQINTLQEDNERIKKENDEKIMNMRFDAEIEKALSSAKHPDLVSGKIDRTKLKINEDGSVDGLNEQVSELKKSYADLFVPQKKGKEPRKDADDPMKKPEEMSYEDFVREIEHAE